MLSKLKLYIYYNNVTLVGHYSGLECINHGFNNIFNRFNILLGLLGLLNLGHTERRRFTSKSVFRNAHSSNYLYLYKVKSGVKSDIGCELRGLRGLRGLR